MVELSVMPRMYLPLAADGLARTTLLMTVVALSISFCGGKESLPTGTCTRAVLSVRNSTLPALISRMPAATSLVTVPVLGLGIRPRGPSTLPRRPTDFIMSGVAIKASKSVQLSFWIRSTMSSPPDEVGPGSFRFTQTLAGGDDRYPLGFAQSVGQDYGTADHLVGVLGV